ncbi:MAG TPA: hypothetical protein VKQ30_14675 [Ktedonobacterales bacterium]|nr:hypothetical protein [Ktedonobacterales bacterium]
MAAAPAPISLYATRWKAFLMTLFFAGLLLGDLLSYFAWPTPAVQTHPWLYQEPTKTIFFIVWTLICVLMLALGLYWTLTTRPLLQLSATSLIYRPFPRPTRTIVWDNVEWLTAFPSRGTRQRSPARILTLRVTFKPHHLFADRAPQKLQLDINLQLLSLSADEVTIQADLE